MSPADELQLSREPIGASLSLSVACHAGLLLATVLWSFFDVPFLLGDPSGEGGGAVRINPVTSIPIQSRNAPPNPVANPTKHDVPHVPAEKTEVPIPAEEPEAIPIEEQRKRKSIAEATKRSRRKEPKPNQVSSTTGAAASSPLFGSNQSGGGGVGFGKGTPFGAGFGWYAEALQRRLSEEWRKTLGQVDGSASEPVIVSFRILRTGAIERIRLEQTSGNRSLDYSALRAATNSSPLQPLPQQLRKNSITVEMWFRLQ